MGDKPLSGVTLMRTLLASFVIVLALFEIADARDAAAVGAGGFTCGQFADDYRKNPAIAEGAYFSWAQGFMSGLNVARLTSKQPAKNLGAKTSKQLESHLRSFCHQNPLVDYGRAVFLMYDGLPTLTKSIAN